MPDNSDFYNNGLPKWGTVSNSLTSSQNVVINETATFVIVNIGCNIKTNVIGKSLKIIDPLNPFLIIGHFYLSEISLWTIVGTTIVIHSSDEVDITLFFNDEIEAEIGDKRIYKIMEGNNIQDCGDENLV